MNLLKKVSILSLFLVLILLLNNCGDNNTSERVYTLTVQAEGQLSL